MEEQILIPIGTLVYKLVTDKCDDPWIMIGVVIDARRYTSKEHPEEPPYDEYDVRWFAGAPDNIVERYGFVDCCTWKGDGYKHNSFERNPDIIAQEWKDWAVSTMDERLAAVKSAQAEGRFAVYPKEDGEEY